jgi:DNA repair protein RadC
MIIHEARVEYVRKEVEEILLDEPEKIYNHVYKFLSQHAENPTVEHLVLICLNPKNKVVNTKILTIGTGMQTLVKPAEVIKHVLLNNCNAFIIGHNHPMSGDPSPSSADLNVTRNLREVARVMDMHFLDHVIIGERQNDPIGLGYYSFRSAGVL